MNHKFMISEKATRKFLYESSSSFKTRSHLFMCIISTAELII